MPRVACRGYASWLYLVLRVVSHEVMRDLCVAFRERLLLVHARLYESAWPMHQALQRVYCTAQTGRACPVRGGVV